ncbi:histidine kinase dimerization/phospho-acceptor domain-containing protein [Pseudomonas frederiksbergensis]|uniref:histidine kinase dimerization/phospho-acceptor domain-containing protein n=1 Tax=Pseudomonas frederiksbergensis TaxID=104087 RepID=UPI003D245D03
MRCSRPLVPITRPWKDKVRSQTRELDVAKCIAERASHLKSEHLIHISHEIRTPLNGIMGALSLLERSTLSEQQQELIARAPVLRFSVEYHQQPVGFLSDRSWAT